MLTHSPSTFNPSTSSTMPPKMLPRPERGEGGREVMALVFLSLSGQGEVIRTAATEEEEEEDKLEREESRRGKNPLVGGRSGGVTCVPLSLSPFASCVGFVSSPLRI